MRKIAFIITLITAALGFGVVAGADEPAPDQTIIETARDAEHLRPMAVCKAWKSSARIGIGYCAASGGIATYRLYGSCRNVYGQSTTIRSGVGSYGGVLSVVCPQATKLVAVWLLPLSYR